MSEFSRYWDAESSSAMPPPARVPAQPAPAAPPPSVPYAAAPAIPLLGPIGPAPGPRRRFTARRLVTNTLIFLIGVGGGAVAFAWVQARFDAPSAVPRDLRAYVAGGGVAYAPAGQGYSVRLPGAPVHRDGPSTAVGHAAPMFVHRSIVTGSDFQIDVRETDLTGANALKDGLLGAVYDPKYSGTTELVNVHPVTFAGQPAYAFDAGLSTGVPIRNRMFVAGKRLFLISVQSESADKVFAALTASFHVRRAFQIHSAGHRRAHLGGAKPS